MARRQAERDGRDRARALPTGSGGATPLVHRTSPGGRGAAAIRSELVSGRVEHEDWRNR